MYVTEKQADAKIVVTAPNANIEDKATIILGGGFRLPSVTAASVADRGVVVLGGGFRHALPRVTDRGAIVLGGGFRLV